MSFTAQVMEMMQTLMADGHTDVDHGGLALFYEKMGGFVKGRMKEFLGRRYKKKKETEENIKRR
jgi:hypothetical protein